MITVVHEAVVTQAHAKRHCLLPRLAVALEWNEKGKALGGLAPGGLGEAGEKPTTNPTLEAPEGQGSVFSLLRYPQNMSVVGINKPQA